MTDYRKPDESPQQLRPRRNGRAKSNNTEAGERSRPSLTDVPASLPEAALFYANLALPVVPLHSVRSGLCSCGEPVDDENVELTHRSAGKHPRTLHGSLDATADVDQVAEWWSKWPRANIGHRMDGMNLLVLDIDPRNGGDVSLAKLEKQYGRLPTTVTVDTGGGGSHFYLTHDGEPIYSSKKLGPGLDLIGKGGLVVAPPSRHLSRQCYQYREDCLNHPVPVPNWIVEIAQRDTTNPIKKSASSRSKSTRSSNSSGQSDGELSLEKILLGVPEGRRDDTIFRYACHLQASGRTKEEARALITAAHSGLDEGSHPFTLDDALMKVDEVWERYEGGGPTDGGKKPSAASQLIEIAKQQCDLFHDEDDAFGTLTRDDHLETYALGSSKFRSWLRAEFWGAYKKAPNSQAFQDALSTLEAIALFEGAQRSVFIRVAEVDGSIYIDIGDDKWRVIEITPAGGTILESSTVRFQRPTGSEALPEPKQGGTLEDLREFVNVSEEDFVLVLAFLVAALRPGRPCPILALNGEQGSAKSTLCRIIRRLIDPNASPIRRPPRNTEDLMVAARHSHLLVFDNMSGVRDWLSDDLCAVVTGTGMSVRRLYTNFDEANFKTMSPIVINGIEEIGTRGDFLDRVIPITLPVIDDSQRRTEDAFNADFERAAPAIMGALINAVGIAMSRSGGIKLDSHGRMADFYEWAAAAAPGIGYSEEEVLAALDRVRGRTTAAVLEGSVLVGPLRELLGTHHGRFVGNASKLLNLLEGFLPSDGPPPKGWPSGPKALGDQLRRLAPDLRRSGIDALQIPSGRKWRITRLDEE